MAEPTQTAFQQARTQAVAGNRTRRIRIEGRTAYVPLTQGQVAVIDAADVPKVEHHLWYAKWNSYLRNYYAVTSFPTSKSTLGMHQLICGSRRGQHVDHANHNTLDNRRSNLRVCSHADNERNRRLPSNNTSGYMGVTKDKKRWVAQVGVNGRSHHLGTFDTAEEAAHRRDAWIREHAPSEYWSFNFPKPGEHAVRLPRRNRPCRPC